MGIKAGKLRDRIRIERMGPPVDDGYTEKPGTFAPIGDRWTEVNYGKGSERREAAQVRASMTATFRVRRCRMTASITPADRLRFDPSRVSTLDAAPVWEITSAVPAEADGIDVTAVRAG
ncbi:phage head completion protein [Allosphingosinicella indica]|uniref:Phage head-tail joining protein n=1 Tax=Allosphingosinicella indica TaxID=941907 RepID=A0A1X7GJ72_9SPHN|nr:head-tail adaptor protein [Allosphingosinicella indica]SMF70537.1 Phage head-tail joining protein [Allosphingosinicella indica]